MSELIILAVSSSYSHQSETEQTILAKLIRSQHEIDSITALENFILGFRLDVRMMAECMDESDGDIREVTDSG